MNTISINELYKIQEKKEADKIKIYKLILSKFYEKIIYLSKMGRIELFYQLPERKYQHIYRYVWRGNQKA